MNTTWNILRKHVKNLLLILAAAALTAGCFSSAEPTQPTFTSPPLSPTVPAESPPIQTSPPEKPTTSSPTIEPTETARPEPVRVILFIGDGMGAEHRQAATWLGFGRDGQLVMDELKVHGSLRTTSVGNQVTDSAAAATALASGVKTRNGLVGLNPDKEEVITAFDRAQQLGLAVLKVPDLAFELRPAFGDEPTLDCIKSRGELLLEPLRRGDYNSKKLRRIYNLLAGEVDTVAPVLAEKMLNNNRNAAVISFSSPLKMFFKVPGRLLSGRDIVSDKL